MQIEFNDTLLTDKFLRVESRKSATSFVYRPRNENPDIKDVLLLLKEVRSLCKNKGIKIKRIGYKKLLEGFMSTGEYSNMVNIYNIHWKELKEGWERLIDDGLYAPITDNTEYNRLQKIEFEMQKFGYRNSILFQVNSIYKNLRKLKNEINSDDCSLYSVSL